MIVDIILIHPLSITLLTIVSAAMTVGVVLFLACCTYMRRTTVSGVVMPDVGLVKVYTLQLGVVVERAYHFMSTLAGDLPASRKPRALFAGDMAGFRDRIDTWPGDLRKPLMRLARGAMVLKPQDRGWAMAGGGVAVAGRGASAVPADSAVLPIGSPFKAAPTSLKKSS